MSKSQIVGYGVLVAVGSVGGTVSSEAVDLGPLPQLPGPALPLCARLAAQACVPSRLLFSSAGEV